ncbi:hypothetical protein BD560DRAFT_436251 [Blakeslea trispora]|nr:hypothetical protein BD560DRAFT_436251 [Blakeslea trispora]
MKQIDESSKHYKNAKKILRSYLNDLHWIQSLKLPEGLLRYVSKLKNKKDKVSSHLPIHIKNNYGTINVTKRQTVNNYHQANDVVTSSTSATPSKRDVNEDAEEKDSFNFEWKTFLLKAENDDSIHEYSPAKHGIICSGDNVSGSPHYPAEIYNEYREKKKSSQKIYSMGQEVCSYIDQDCLKEFKKNIANIPVTEDTSIDSQVLFLEEIFAASLKLYKINVPLSHNEAIETFGRKIQRS